MMVYLGCTYKTKPPILQLLYFPVISPQNIQFWGRDADEMFTQLTGEMYSHQEADLVVVYGDFNARIGNESDYITVR